LKFSHVSGTICVSTIRVMIIITIITLMMGTEMFPEMENLNHQTWLMAKEDFIKMFMSVSVQNVTSVV
jgi:hypothetical protein